MDSDGTVRLGVHAEFLSEVCKIYKGVNKICENN